MLKLDGDGWMLPKTTLGCVLIALANLPQIATAADADLNSLAATALRSLPPENSLEPSKSPKLAAFDHPTKPPIQSQTQTYPVWVQWAAGLALGALSEERCGQDGCSRQGGR
ncbi:hypothetical protein [Burkholderia ubonensis]|uniref:hypothetical protein n=1 Tax=Burkholderia ubonensis TaxID=101571 RepID=UPI0012F9F0F8|nr:hypothetical protein [Burkholderia ubonensis]